MQLLVVDLVIWYFMANTQSYTALRLDKLAATAQSHFGTTCLVQTLVSLL